MTLKMPSATDGLFVSVIHNISVKGIKNVSDRNSFITYKATPFHKYSEAKECPGLSKSIA